MLESPSVSVTADTLPCRIYSVLHAGQLVKELQCVYATLGWLRAVGPFFRFLLFTDRTPRSFALFRRMARTTLKYIFPPEGWETEMVEDNNRAYAFNMVSCFYLDVVTAYGAPELTPVYCRMDELLYERLPPTIRWQRTRILGKGDDCCNFRWSLRDEARF